MSAGLCGVRMRSCLMWGMALTLILLALPRLGRGQVAAGAPGPAAATDVLGRKAVRPLALREAVQLGLKNNLDVAIAYNNLKAAPFALLAQIQDTMLEIHRAYYTLALRIEELTRTREGLARAEILMENNGVRVQAGGMAPIELKVARAQVAHLQSAILTAEDNVRVSEMELKRLVDASSLLLRADTAIVPTDRPKCDLQEIDEGYCIVKALASRSDLAQMKGRLKEQGIEVKLSKGEFGPESDLAASFQANGLTKPVLADDDPLFKGPTFDPQQGLKLVTPLDGELAQKARLLREAKRVELQVVADVRNSVLLARSNARKAQATRTARELCQERLDASEKQLEVGRITSFELVTAQDDLRKDQLDEIRAVSDYALSLDALRRQMGGFLDEIGGQAKEPAFSR